MSLQQRITALAQAVGADIKQLQQASTPGSFFSLVTVAATSASQTSFTIPGGYTPGAIVVFLNGSSLAPAHYTATNGTTVVLASDMGVIVGSELVVLKLTAFQVADALPLLGTAADSNKLGGQLPAAYLNDMLSSLAFSEVSIGAAATLTASAFGRMHVCTGTTANYTITLPSASGNAGKMIGIRMAASLSRLVTVAAAGSDLIDGQAQRVMWSGESAVLMCTGSGWTKISGVSKPLTCGAYPSSNVTVALSPTLTLVPLSTAIFDSSGLMLDGSTSRVNILRSGVYRVSANTYYKPGTAAASELQCIVNRNATVGAVGTFTDWRTIAAAEPCRSIYIDDASLTAGDYVQLMARLKGSVRDLYTNDATWTFLKISEVISW